MAMRKSKRTIKECQETLKGYKPVIPFKDLTIGEDYYVPPILTIERMTGRIVGSAEGNKLKFKFSKDGKQKEVVFGEDSVLAKFITTKRDF